MAKNPHIITLIAHLFSIDNRDVANCFFYLYMVVMCYYLGSICLVLHGSCFSLFRAGTVTL